MNDTVSNQQKNRMHPHKFTLWVGIGSIIMMFAGLTSAYIVKGSLPGWSSVEIPRIFYISSVVMLLSSVTIQMANKAFKARNMQQYRRMVLVTTVLGIVFIAMQLIGFQQLLNRGVTMRGGAGAGQFLYIIFGLHGLHVVGGLVALLILFTKAFNSKTRNYDPVSIEIAGTYWHFVDLLWIYLFVFFLITA
jgi:cytochrome c oxidase subunit 3